VKRLAALRHHAGSLAGRPRRHHFLRALPQNAVAAEIGVFRGEFTRHILRTCKPQELHLIDAWWTLFGDRYPNWGAYTDFGELKTRTAYEDCRRVVRRYARGSRVRIHVGDDLEILESFADRHFDWVYLDSSHQYQHTRDELAVLDKKVKEVITGDDLVEDETSVNHGLSVAVKEFCALSDWRLESVDAFGQWRLVRSPSRPQSQGGTGQRA
jgi:hypothetical protein